MANDVKVELKIDDIYTKIQELAKEKYIELIKGGINGEWKLSQIYPTIKSNYSNLSIELKNGVKERYKEASVKQLDENKNSHKTTENLTKFFVQYIVKRRAALIYVCMLYLDTIENLKKQIQPDNSAELAKIIDASGKVIEAYNMTLQSGSPQPLDIPRNSRTAVSSLQDLATKIAELKNAIDKANAAKEAANVAKTEQQRLAKEREELLEKIIPFLASQTEIDEPLNGAVNQPETR